MLEAGTMPFFEPHLEDVVKCLLRNGFGYVGYHWSLISGFALAMITL